MRRLALLSLSLGLFGGWAAAQADEPIATPDGVAFFEQKIRPVLAEHCLKCHGGGPTDKIKGGLRLDSRSAIRKGGDGGPIIVPGDPEASRLIQALRHDDDELKMPPKQPLSDREIADFVTWVKLGVPDPSEALAATPGQPAERSAIDWAKAREFWSFRPITDPAVPEVHDQAWAQNDVDRFLRAKLAAKGLSPAPSASKRTLIRRATFDLTGLPPTPEEVDAFLADESPNAFESVVDRLLASPHYGERWGRHWLDLVRYADTSGCNSDYPVPSAHKYRDYVIDAFNRDTPFDRFVQEQVAGDLLPHQSEAERVEQIVATGYLAIARRFGSHNNEFHLTYEDMIDNLGKTVLGLSISCARCHNHKFDPIPQRDYYAIYGILQSTKYAFPGTEIYQHPKDFVALGTLEEAEALRTHETRLDEVSRQVLKLGVEKKALLALEKTNQAAVLKGRTLLEVRAELGDALDLLKKLENDPPDVEKAFAASEGTPGDAKLQRKGDPKNEGDPVPRGFLQVLGGNRVSEGSPTSGRLELARWLTAKDNPLTARVMVNRIWQHHFGRGIVATPNDFGTRGQPPTHPELLDWLATRFIEEGWSVKAMHRRLMLTRGYQMASVDDPARAKRVIFLYMSGGVSHLDSFDPKPRLVADQGKPKANVPGARPYLPPFWEFQPRGQCGTEISNLFPNLAESADELCLIRSMHGDHNDHFQATLGIHTGSVSVARPSFGSWVSYGLGTVNQNLPSFVVLAPRLPYAGSQVWSADFLPGCHQGTRVLAGAEPIPDLNRRSPSPRIQQAELGLLDRLNQRHQHDRPGEPALAARIRSFETAFGMQQAMPDVLDLTRETKATLSLYGLERGQTQGFAWQCLVARRMVERGVRFVELIDSGSSNNWDSHADMKAHGPMARNVDRPIAGLLRDLKSRGLLDDTLVVWTSEFGRTPTTDGPTGRSHQSSAYSSWLAGAGVKGGLVHGKTDDYGAKVVEDGVHVHDFHATILHLLGFDHERLTYRHAGRDFRLTDVEGRVVEEILA